jgi:membrane protein involved in colicin uptake
MDTWTQSFWSELEHLGEDEVRGRLAKRFYSDSEREAGAREWLHQKESARQTELELRRAQREAGQLEQAVRASNAAERAAEAAERTAEAVERTARAAEEPNRKASIAIMIAVTAAVISVLSLLAHFLK